MGDAGNHINHIAVAGQDAGQRLNNVFDPLVRREQTEREQNILAFRSEMRPCRNGGR